MHAIKRAASFGSVKSDVKAASKRCLIAVPSKKASHEAGNGMPTI
jgi:hypothetical protein